MKKLSAQGAVKAFTLIELLVVVTIVAILIAMLTPTAPHPDKSPRTHCLSNAKQNVIGFVMRADDLGNKFPWEISTNNNGTREFVESGSALFQFQSLAEMPVSPNSFVCPGDKQRKPAVSFANLAATNISYFVNADASTTNLPSATILLGDRNLAHNQKAVVAGLFLLATNANMSWTPEFHKTGGILAFADGHAEFVKREHLKEKVQQQPLATSRLLIP